MKTQHFKVSNSGKSPATPGVVHQSTGVNVPAGYARQMGIVNKIAQRMSHIRPKKGWGK